MARNTSSAAAKMDEQTERDGAPEAIPGRDASDLEWLLGEGGATFERSTTGAILERLLRESDGWRDCSICDGRGILTSKRAVRRHVAAKRPTERRDRHELHRVPIHGTGVSQDGQGVLEMRLVVGSVPVSEGSWCQFCNGTGAVAHARPRGNPVHAVYPGCHLVGGLDAQPGPKPPAEVARSEPDSVALIRFARVSRRLALLCEQDRLVLTTYHGDVGARWGREPAGRVFALYPLTRGGRSLLGKGRGVEGGGGVGGAADRLWSTVSAHMTQPHHRTHRALEQADAEAREILAEAAAAWVATDAKRLASALLSRLERRYPAPLPPLEALLAEVEGWDPEVWAGAPSRSTDGVWR